MKTKRKRNPTGKSAAKRTSTQNKRMLCAPLREETGKAETSSVGEQDDIQGEAEDLDDLAQAQRIFLEDWFAGRSLHGDDSERARELIEKELIGEGMSSWSPGSEYEQDDVLAADILYSLFEGFPVLEVHGSWMCAGGLSFSLCHADFLNRQALCFIDSFLDTNCAVRLPVFYTRDDLEVMIYEIIGSRYDYDSSAWDRNTSTLVSDEELRAWRERICAPPKKDGTQPHEPPAEKVWFSSSSASPNNFGANRSGSCT